MCLGTDMMSHVLSMIQYVVLELMHLYGDNDGKASMQVKTRVPHESDYVYEMPPRKSLASDRK